MKKILIFMLIALMLMNTMLIAYAEQVEQLKIAIGNEEGTLNPYTYVMETGATLFKLIYDPMFNKGPDLQPEPWLVKNYSVNDDNTVYTFEIYDNVKFHDGEPLTAEDIKFTYDYLQEYVKSRFTTDVETKILDDYKVEMTLPSPQAEFLTRPLAEMGILPKHIWEDITEPETSRETVGSGPYILKEIQDGEYYNLEANNDYFKGEPVTKKLFIPIIKDRNAMFTALRSGQVDVTTNELPPEIVEQFKTEDSLKVVEGPGYSTTLLLFNNEKHPFDNKDFRKALTYATNRQEIVDVVMLGMATKGSLGFVHPDSAAYSEEVNKVSYNIDEANRILDELNYMDTDNDNIRESNEGEALSFELLVYANNPTRIRIAELIQEYYAEIGVEIVIKAMDTAVVDDLIWPGFVAANGRDYDIGLWGWGASTMGSTVRYVQMFHSDLEIAGSNIVAYKSEEMDEVLNEMMNVTDSDESVELQKEFQNILSNDVPVITLYYPNLAFAYNSNVHDDWTFIQGQGIVNNLSLINFNTDEDATNEENNDETATEEEPTNEENEEETSTEEPESNTSRNLLILGGMIAVAVVFYLISKNKSN